MLLEDKHCAHPHPPLKFLGLGLGLVWFGSSVDRTVFGFVVSPTLFPRHKRGVELEIQNEAKPHIIDTPTTRI